MNFSLSQLCVSSMEIIIYLKGKPVIKPDLKHCAQVGKTLAHIHQTGFSYEGVLDNVMGKSWWESISREMGDGQESADVTG